MLLIPRISIVAAVAAAAVASAAPAVAHGFIGSSAAMVVAASHSYSGAWPVTISGSQRDNGTGCLTLTGIGPSGQASLTFGSQKYPYGSFIVINDILVVNITEPLYGQNGVLMFMSHADRGRIGTGVFEDVEGGSNFDNGKLAYGMKNGC